MCYMADECYAAWRSENVADVTTAAHSHFQDTNRQVRHLCPVTDYANPDYREHVKLCINSDHLALGTPKDNADDGRYSDPDRIMARVKDSRLAGSRQSPPCEQPPQEPSA